MLKTVLASAKSDVTRRSYELKINKALAITGSKTAEGMLTAHRKSLAALRAHYRTHSTFKQTLTAIVSMLSSSPDWRDAHKSASAAWIGAHAHAARAMAEDRKFTRFENVEHKFVCKDEIVKMKRRLKKTANTGDLMDSMTYLLLVLCTDVPPKRADYNDLRIVTKDTHEGNYIVKHAENKLELVMHEYKTSKDVAYREMLPRSVSRDIVASLEAFPRAFLFSGAMGGPMTPGAYSQFVIRRFMHLFDKRIGLSSLRHIYISDLYENDASPAAKRAAAVSMQHSMDVQKTYVVKRKNGAAVCG